MAVFIDGELQPGPGVEVISETVKINGEVVQPKPITVSVTKPKRKPFWKRWFSRK